MYSMYIIKKLQSFAVDVVFLCIYNINWQGIPGVYIINSRFNRYKNTSSIVNLTEQHRYDGTFTNKGWQIET